MIHRLNAGNIGMEADDISRGDDVPLILLGEGRRDRETALTLVL